jgi:PAS domain S-box-containing protein
MSPPASPARRRMLKAQNVSSAPTPPDAFLAAIINSSGDAILSKDLQGVITSWNPGAERLFGYTADEAIGQPITMLYPDARPADEPGILERIRRGERIDHYETVRRRKDGRLINISLTVSPIRDQLGNIVGASKIARDITAQKRDQENFRVTLGSIADAVITTGTDGRISFMNVVAERLTGWTLAEASDRPLQEVAQFFAEGPGDVRRDPLAAVIEQGRAVFSEGQAVLRSREGQTHLITGSAAPIRTTPESISGIVLVFRDVSERRESELAAVRLAAIVENSDDAIVSKNLDGIVTSWNRGAERLFGYTAAEMIGQPILRVLPADRLNEERQILARLQRGERVDHFETKRRRRDGTLFDVSLTISPIKDKSGRIIGASKIARDITEIRSAQEKLRNHARDLEIKVRERTAKLEETVAELEAFSYSLSHDMRAPLRAIHSFTEIVMEDYGDKIPEGRAYLEKVVMAARRMDRLIQDVLAFARVSQTDIVLGPVDPTRVVNEILQERLELHPPAANVKILGKLPLVIGHEASLMQCLTNYLDNAVKFVAPGKRPEVEIFAEDHGEATRICVRDNGIGVDKEGRERLFALFQRLPTQHEYRGTGVGLAIVRKAAERMKGSAGMDSTPGQGSTFWIELPKAT